MAETKKVKLPILRRYTNMAALIHTLTTKQIALVSPKHWDDENDRVYLEKYRKLARLKSVLALCLSKSDETYHHWKVFAPGADGVCIEFYANGFMNRFRDVEDVTMGDVDYVYINTLKARLPQLRASDLPFLKRKPYKPESEFRLIYSSPHEKLDAKAFDISLGLIKQVTLSPWLPDTFYASVHDALRNIPECESVSVKKTSLISTSTWQRIASQVRGPQRAALEEEEEGGEEE